MEKYNYAIENRKRSNKKLNALCLTSFLQFSMSFISKNDDFLLK